MNRRAVIIDCDPGLDDAIGLFLAMAARDQLDILGITTVAGNVPLEFTQRNARHVCDIARREDIPVFAGCTGPLQRELITAELIHGPTGFGEIDTITPRHPLESRHAVDFIIRTLRARPDNATTLVLTGPLTNAATALTRDREIRRKIAEIVVMGGAMREAGNYSPSAEFNFLLDPHAAEIVLECGRPITMLGLDATHQVLVSRAVRERIGRIDNEPARATRRMLDFYARTGSERFGDGAVPLHDPCTLAWLLRPELFAARDCFVAVETQSPLTMGHTAVDFWGVTPSMANAAWVYEVDAAGVFDLLIAHLERF